MRNVIFPAFILFSTLALGQEIGYLDLTTAEPRTQLRFPPAPTAACKNGESCVGPGWGVGSVSCGAADPRDPRALKTTLTSLDQISYVPGEQIVFEVKLENVGSVSIPIPWNPNLADLQPQDASKTFNYLEMYLALEFRNENAQFSPGRVTFYGREEITGSTLLLHPGEWVRARGMIKLEPSAQMTQHIQNHPNSEWFANAGFALRHDTFTPAPGGYGTHTGNDNPRSSAGQDVWLEIKPSDAGKKSK